MPPEKVVLAIRMGQYTEVTPGTVDIPQEEEQAREKAEEAETKRRSRINLEAIGINAGAVLTLSRDQDVHATVVGGNRVQHEGQIMSLSASALEALHKLGYTSLARFRIVRFVQGIIKIVPRLRVINNDETNGLMRGKVAASFKSSLPALLRSKQEIGCHTDCRISRNSIPEFDRAWE